jgi:hypothetical protein
MRDAVVRGVLPTTGSRMAAAVLLDLVIARSDNGLPPELGFGIVLAGWPAAFVLLGAAGWAGDRYHGEVVALIALVVSGLVALVQTLRFTVLWTSVATFAVALGAWLGGSLLPEPLVAAGAVVVGAAFGNRLRHVIEEFLDSRRRLLHEVTRIPTSSDPFTTAAAGNAARTKKPTGLPSPNRAAPMSVLNTRAAVTCAR